MGQAYESDEVIEIEACVDDLTSRKLVEVMEEKKTARMILFEKEYEKRRWSRR